MPVKSEEIQLKFEGGQAAAHLALPEAGGGPGILLLHAWWGLNPFFKQVCDRLAGQGYVVLAPDLNRGEVVETVPAAKDLMARRDIEFSRGAMLAGRDRLLAHPARTGTRIGAIGYSMGANWSLELSALSPGEVGAVVLYYGTGAEDFTRVKARFLGHFAQSDEWEPLEEVQAMEKDMKSAGLDVTFHLYLGVSHWFVEADRSEYDEKAAGLAWKRTLAFLKESL